MIDVISQSDIIMDDMNDDLILLAFTEGFLAVNQKKNALIGTLNKPKSKRIVIPYYVRREGEMVGFDAHFRPTCVREHSYCYDSFDEKYNALKLTRPKECATCPS